MASLTIRNLSDEDKQRLRIRAAHKGRSMEAEARAILKDALGEERPAKGKTNLAEQIRARFARLGGVDLPEIEREPMREPPTFE